MEYQTFVSQLLDTDNLDEVVGLCSDYIQNPIVIINNAFDIVAHSKKNQPDDEAWLLSVNRGYITMEFSHNLAQWSSLKQFDPLTDSLLFTEISAYRRKFYHLIFKGELLGYLNVTEYEHTFEDCTEEQYALIKTALAKELYNHNIQMRQGHKSEEEHFLFSCCEDLYSTTDQLLEHYKRTSLSKYATLQFVLINLEHLESYNANRDTLQDDLSHIFNSNAIIIHNDYLVVLLDTHAIELHYAEFLDYLKAHNFQAYLSLPMTHPQEFTKTYKRTCHAKRLCHITDNTQLVTPYRNLLLVDLFDQASQSIDLSKFVHPVFLMIHTYDKANDTAYLKTLFHYFRTNHSIQKTADTLFVHRNTVSYRLNKIEDLFALDYEDEQIGFNCYTSVLLLSILNQ